MYGLSWRKSYINQSVQVGWTNSTCSSAALLDHNTLSLLNSQFKNTLVAIWLK